jgi:hypothetical protein
MNEKSKIQIVGKKKTRNTREALRNFAHVDRVIPSRERNHSRDLEKTYLESIS